MFFPWRFAGRTIPSDTPRIPSGVEEDGVTYGSLPTLPSIVQVGMEGGHPARDFPACLPLAVAVGLVLTGRL